MRQDSAQFFILFAWYKTQVPVSASMLVCHLGRLHVVKQFLKNQKQKVTQQAS